MKPIAQVIDGRRSMRTLADALVKLEKAGLLKEGDHATIRTCWMQLPDGAVVATVAVIAPGEQQHGVMLPSAARFTAKNTVGERRERDLVELDGAVADRDGNVQLPNGSYVHAVELIPVPSARGVDRHREESASLRPQVLDYALVAKVGAGQKLQSLKAIEREVSRRMPHITRQTLATALARAGLRRPRSGKRARPRSSCATILPDSV